MMMITTNSVTVRKLKKRLKEDKNKKEKENKKSKFK